MVKAHPLNNPHSAGIFADMSIDGPEIGTLVLIVDRAKNLPNRKTIGKQDPYCAARLGKEAKKTTTDIRGGQTPKWDQELRFIVHDSPDYYQLKLSVFNDDKKTELIGEAWIDLRDIIVPGGGQKDDWQSLSCRSKYAGDIRIEITFYDARPKPEKPAAKPKPVASDSDLQAGHPKVPKRRPLPSDPYTGQAPALPPQPAPVPTASRSQAPIPRDLPLEFANPEHVQASSRAPLPNPPSGYPASHASSHSGQYGTPPSLRQRHPENYSSAPSSAYHTPPPALPHGSSERERYSSYQDDTFAPDHQGHTPDMRYISSAPYGAPTGDPTFMPEVDDDRPPPPPAHRITPGSTPDISHHGQTPPIMRKDVLRQEAHRVSGSGDAYPGRPVYRAYDSAPSAPLSDTYSSPAHQSSPPRHHSYETPQHKSMQPTVEDAPDSDSPEYRRNNASAPPYNPSDYRDNPSPAPLQLSGRNSAPIVTYHAPQRHDASPDYSHSDMLADYNSPSASQLSYNSQSSYDSYGAGHGSQSRGPDTTRYEMPAVPTSLIPGVDPIVSMEISHRLNEDRRHERRNTQPQLPPVGSMRGRQMIDLPPGYSSPRDRSRHYSPSQQHFDPRDRSPAAYAGRAPSQQSPVRRAISPSQSPGGHSTIRRKSVSPAPPQPDSRRLSGIPFGPDSYDALNPTIAGNKPKEIAPDYDEINGKIITHDGREVDPSDHLPMDTWAPEPEPKGGKKSDSASTRPALSGPQPPPPSGRKALRIRERPASSLPPATYITPEVGYNTLPPPSTGRNRLQKKVNRHSAMPTMSGANGPGPGLAPSPLAPLPQIQDGSYAPRAPARASTIDYENHMPMYGGVGRDHSASAPPVPAKLPIGGGGGGEVSLMEEMSRIDIGSGRARRHAQRPAIGGY